MKEQVEKILIEIGEDIGREGLRNTPERVSESLRMLTRGDSESIDEVVNGAVFECDANDMVIVKDIELFSLCEHHMLPFFGKCHIGYIPRGKVLGVSKLARIADVYARRLQIQERLTNQIANALMDKLDPVGVGVVIEAKHLCMMMRGVEKQHSTMQNSAMLGCFRTRPATRNEFLQLIRE